MQVLLGSLTTGLSALAVSGGKSVNTIWISSPRYLTFWFVNFFKDCSGNYSSWYVVITRHSNGRPAQIFYIGALATLVASYLARARGSNEPEVSITRTKALDQLIRECQAFQMDYGHLQGRQYDPPIIQLRRRLEEILSNGNRCVWFLLCIYLYSSSMSPWW